MRNWTRCSGVYTNMLRVPLFLVCSLAALAQPSPRQDPLDTALQAVWQARNNGRFEVAAAGREQARAQLQRAPVDSPRFAGWAQQVAQLYQSSSLNAQARAILREALARTGLLGDSHPSRIATLNALGESWRQDGNLLKAVGYLEQADIFALPSADEAFGVSILEAISRNVPVLAMNHSGVSDIIKNGVNGYLANNLMEFESYLRILIENPVLRTSFAQKANQELSNFDWDRICEQTSQVYSKVIYEKYYNNN